MEGDKLKKDIPRRPSGLFYIEGSRAFYFEENLASPLGLDFPADSVSDLEIINKKKLDSVIHAFITTYKVTPKNVMILLSTSVTFDKSFPQTTLELPKNIDEFLELVPFENYIAKQAKFPGTIKVVAANKELCDTVKNSFVGLGFVVSGVYPLSFCLELFPQLQTNLDLGFVINKSPELRSFNLLPDSEAPGNSPKKEKKDNKRLLILGGIFAILVVILLFVIYRFIILSPKPVQTLPVSLPPPQPTIFEEESSPSSQLQPENTFSTSSGNTKNTP